MQLLITCKSASHRLEGSRTPGAAGRTLLAAAVAGGLLACCTAQPCRGDLDVALPLLKKVVLSGRALQAPGQGRRAGLAA